MRRATDGRAGRSGGRHAAVRATLALALAAVVALALAAPARAGTFEFSQCSAVYDGRAAPRGYHGDLWWIDGGFGNVDAGHVDRDGMAGGRAMRQSASGNPAYLTLRASGARLVEVPSGAGTVPGTPQRLAMPAGARTLRFSTWCSARSGLAGATGPATCSSCAA